MSNDIISFIDLLTDDLDLSVDEIFEFHPEFKEQSASIIQNIHSRIEDLQKTKDMPWLEKAKLKREKFIKIKNAMADNFEDFKKLAKDFKEGQLEGSFLPHAEQFFRDRDIDNISEEEIAELIRDVKVIEELKKE